MIVVSTGCCFVNFYKFELLILSSRLIPRMFLRHLFANTWADFMAVNVSLQVSDPYRSTDFTLMLIKNMSLVLVLMLVNIGLKMAKACCASCFLP